MSTSTHSNSDKFISAVELGKRNLDDSIAAVTTDTRTLQGSNYGIPGATSPLMDDRDDGHHQNKTTVVQWITTALVVIMFAILLVLIAVTSATYYRVDNQKLVSTTVYTYDSLGLPGYESYSWEDIVSQANGQTLNFWTYDDDVVVKANGSTVGVLTKGPYDTWIDDWLTPKLSNLYGITLNRIPLNETSQAVNKVILEITKGYGLSNGTVDMIWINGADFATLKSDGYLYGPWATKVPNAVNFDFTSDAIEFDYGDSINGLEMPYNTAQVAFIANTVYLQTSAVSTISQIMSWIVNNPGKFTYAAPCYVSDCSTYDFTGAVFIRHIFYFFAPYAELIGNFNEEVYTKYSPEFFQKLRSLEPYLYKQSGSVYHPSSNDVVDNLFGAGDIYLTLNYDPGHTVAQIDEGIYPSTAQGYVLTSGTLSNTNYVCIPINARHKEAALVAGNYIASFPAMFSRAQPQQIGAIEPFDVSADEYVNGGWDVAFSYITKPSATPSTTDLGSYRLSELQSTYITRISSDWYKCVKTYVLGTSPTYCG